MFPKQGQCDRFLNDNNINDLGGNIRFCKERYIFNSMVLGQDNRYFWTIVLGYGCIRDIVSAKFDRPE